MINRRSLLKVLGLAPALPAAAAFAIEAKAEMPVSTPAAPERPIANDLVLVVRGRGDGTYFATWNPHRGDRMIAANEISRYSIFALRPPEQRWNSDGSSWWHIDHKREEPIASLPPATVLNAMFRHNDGWPASRHRWFGVRGHDFCGAMTALSVAKVI